MFDGNYCAAPCYEHAPAPYTYGTLPDVLNSQTPPISWKYYTPLVDSNGDYQSGLWVAPIAIAHLCQKGSDNKCDGLINNVHIRSETQKNPYPLMDDIGNCRLAAVSWAIPDARWSDHGDEDNGSGPAYVANIVNAIGENTKCVDTVNGKQYSYWQDTAVFITWDDWGGWFDHVPPFKVGGQSNGWGKSYTYGFRVPLLVVSAYTGSPGKGYVSGAISGPPLYPPPMQFTHDFGSILAFIENNFGIPIGSIGSQQYPFADNFAPELAAGVIPLADFFQFPYRTFTAIPVPVGFDSSYFQNYFVNNPTDAPQGPDADDD